MNDNIKDVNVNFFQLIVSLQAGAMQQLGKVISPVSGQIERDLELAKATIDMITMLEEKTKGNLSEDEEKLLGHVLYELRLNYVEETKKEPDDSKETENKKTEQSNDDKSETDNSN
jgi:hypothetical protein